MPRAVCSRRANQSPLAKLEVDLTSKAIAERQVDEGEYRNEKGVSQTDHRNRQQEHGRDHEENAAQSLREVVRLRTILNRTRLDDAARLQDLEVDLLEQRQLRGESAHQQHHCKQRDQR